MLYPIWFREFCIYQNFTLGGSHPYIREEPKFVFNCATWLCPGDIYPVPGTITVFWVCPGDIYFVPGTLTVFWVCPGDIYGILCLSGGHLSHPGTFTIFWVCPGVADLRELDPGRIHKCQMKEGIEPKGTKVQIQTQNRQKDHIPKFEPMSHFCPLCPMCPICPVDHNLA
jgi:hypothetical protein